MTPFSKFFTTIYSAIGSTCVFVSSKKSYGTYVHQIFRASRGHQGLAPCKILGKSDKGILRGQVGEKVFDPISPPLGEMGH